MRFYVFLLLLACAVAGITYNQTTTTTPPPTTTTKTTTTKEPASAAAPYDEPDDDDDADSSEFDIVRVLKTPLILKYVYNVNITIIFIVLRLLVYLAIAVFQIVVTYALPHTKINPGKTTAIS